MIVEKGLPDWCAAGLFADVISRRLGRLVVVRKVRRLHQPSPGVTAIIAECFKVYPSPEPLASVYFAIDHRELDLSRSISDLVDSRMECAAEDLYDCIIKDLLTRAGWSEEFEGGVLAQVIAEEEQQPATV